MATSFSFTDQTAIVGTIQNIVDATGAATTFKAPPTWTSSDTTILAPTVSANGLSITATVLKPGTCTITVVGDGVTETVTLTAVAGSVVSFSVVLAPAPPPAPPAA